MSAAKQGEAIPTAGADMHHLLDQDVVIGGETAGPATGRLVADLIAGRAPGIEPAPYAARRFQ